MATPIQQDSGNVSVTSTFTTVMDVNLAGAQNVLRAEVLNDPGSAGNLVDFKVQLRDHPSGELYDYIGGSDFSGSLPNMSFVTIGGPQSLAPNETAHFAINVRAADLVRLLARAATTATIRARVTTDPD